MNTQPLKFRHIYSSAPWGGKMVGQYYGRTDVPSICSESWEISGHRFGMSVVSEGAYAGRLPASVKSVPPRRTRASS